jgi:hypothetical protein
MKGWTQRGVTDAERFMRHYVCDVTTRCFTWTGGMAGNYGVAYLGGASMPAHRVAWIIEHGSIPDGAWIDHLCRNTLCVNTAHLEPVPPAENNRRGLLGFGLTGLCRAGLHDITKPGSFYTWTNRGHSYRRCKGCEQAREQARRPTKGDHRG